MRTIEGTSIYSKRLGKTYLNVESFMLEKVFHLALLMSHIEMQFKQGREKNFDELQKYHIKKTDNRKISTR